MKLHVLGIDLGKTAFHVVGLDATGRAVIGKKRSRRESSRRCCSNVKMSPSRPDENVTP
jgi:hypothetical protein